MASSVFGQSDCSGLCLPNGTFVDACSMTNYGGCSTWAGSCSGWFVSHGTPTLLGSGDPGTGDCPNNHTVSMWTELNSNGTVYSEGIFTPYHFQHGLSYQVGVSFEYATDEGNPGSKMANLNFLAANGIVAQTPGCLETPQLSGSGFNRTGILIYNAVAHADREVDTVFTYTPDQDYAYLWIYPDGTGFISGGSPTGEEVILEVHSIYICPVCPTGTQSITSGTVPNEMAYGTIDLGSGGSGTVTTATTGNTYLAASSAINITSKFVATAPSGGSVNMQIAPCRTLTSTAARRAADSIAASQFQKTAATAIDSAASKLKIYPTVSSGFVNITGASADLSNAYILVTDESGRTVYKLYNSSRNTNLQLNLGMLGNGLYFLQINNGTKTTTQKIIIQK